MNVVSLFSGIGGIELGLERTGGFRVVAQVEKDSYCRRVLAKHWPDVARFDDVRTFGRSSISDAVDLVAGGFPCQPFSTAGKRRSTTDDRHLWPEMLRIVQEFKPRWVLGENVAGFIPLFLDEALSDLEAEGYEAWAVVLPALAFDAPHIRQRVFIVAYSKSGGWRQAESRVRIQRQTVAVGDGEPVSITKSQRRHARGLRERTAAQKPIVGNSGAVSNPQRLPCIQERQCGRLQLSKDSKGERDTYLWSPEPGIRRVVDGLPHRVDRVRALGNAIVPQVAQWIGQLILQADSQSFA